MSDKRSPPRKQERPSSSKLTPISAKAENKNLKRKLFAIGGGTCEDEAGAEKKTTPKRRRSISVEGSPTPGSTTPKTPGGLPRSVPMSERQQLALVMQMTAETSQVGETSTSPRPLSPHTPASSIKRTPLDKKVNKRNERGETPLHIAAIKGDHKQTKKLIKAGADVNIKDFAGWTPLHEACNHGWLVVARQLLKAGANVNVQGLDNDTPLHDAAINGHHKLVQLLLRHGANPVQTNTRGKAPVDVATDPEIMQLLKKEIITSSSESSSNEDVRSPTSPESNISDREEEKRHESHDSDLMSSPDPCGIEKPEVHTTQFLQHTSKRIAVGHRITPLDKSASPRLTLKFQHIKTKGERGGELLKYRQSRDPQYKSYSVTLGVGGDEYSDSLYSKSPEPRSVSPANSSSSQDSDLYDPGIGSSSSLTTPKKMLLDPLLTSHSEASKVTSSNVSPLHLHGHVPEPPAPSEMPSLGASSSDKQEATSESTAVTVSQESGPFEPHFEDISDDNMDNDEDVGGGVMNVDSSTHAHRTTATTHIPRPPSPVVQVTSLVAEKPTPAATCSSEDILTSSTSLLHTSSNNINTSESLHSSTSMDIAPDTTPEPPSVSSGGNGRLERPKPKESHIGALKTDDSPTDKDDRLSPRGEKENRLSPKSDKDVKASSPKMERELRSSPKSDKDRSSPKSDKDSRLYSKLERERPYVRLERASTRLDKDGKSSPKMDREGSSRSPKLEKEIKPSVKLETNRMSPKLERTEVKFVSKGEKEVRPVSPKVPPLKIIMPTKSSVASSSGDRESLKTLLSKPALPYVLNPTQDTGEGAPLRACESQPTSQSSSRASSPASDAESNERRTRSRTAAAAAAAAAAAGGKDKKEDNQTDNTMSGTTQEKEEVQMTVPAAVQQDKLNEEEKAKEGADKDKEADLREKEERKDGLRAEEKEERRITRSAFRATQMQQQQANNGDVAPHPPEAEPKNHNHHKNEQQQEEMHIHPRKRKLRPRSEHQQTNTEAHPPLPPPQHLEKPVNSYQLYMDIRKQIASKRSQMCVVQPKAPQGFKDYLMVSCNYVLHGNAASRLAAPVLSPPNSVQGPLRELFMEQEKSRYKLRLQHVIEREKLTLSTEQEILRVHGKAARALANQSLPLSVCTVLKDEEIYNPLETEQIRQPHDEKDKSVRSRYNGRQFLSWLQDVDDKYDKIKGRIFDPVNCFPTLRKAVDQIYHSTQLQEALLLRHHHEAESLYAVQKLEWQWKTIELGLCDPKTTPVIDDLHVPMVQVNNDFDLLPV